MKNLLYKEIKLCVTGQTWAFISLSALILIPTWPTLVAFIYPVAGLFPVFPVALANRDLLYTGTLPIEKSRVVLGKILLICFLELVSIAISIPFGLLRNFVLTPLIPVEHLYDELGFNMAMYGLILIAFGLFNLIFFPRFYKSPDTKNVGATLLSYLTILVFYAVCMAFFMAVPGASKYINTYTGGGLWTQIGILVLGIACFLLFNLFAYKASKKRFEKIDL